MKNKEILAILCDMLKITAQGKRSPVFIEGREYEIDGIIFQTNQVRLKDGDDYRFHQIGDIDTDKLPFMVGTGVQVYEPEFPDQDPMEWTIAQNYGWKNGEWSYRIIRAGYFEDETNLEEWNGVSHHKIRKFDKEIVAKELAGILKIFGYRSSRAHHTAEYLDEDGQWRDFPDYGVSDQLKWDRLADLIY